MSYRRRSAPVSSLRASLQQRLDEKNSWAGESDFSLDDSAEASKPFSPAAILMTMHRYLLLKSTVAIVVVFTAAVLIRGGYGWGAPLLQALRFVVEWDLNLDSFSEKVVPAFRLIQDRVERPLNEPEALSPGEPPCPFAGSLQSGFGLRADAVAGRDQMHYGIDLVAPEGTAVRAVLEGRVVQIVSGENSLGTVIMAGEPGWTVFYRGLAAVEVKEGEIVKQGSLLGTLGPPRFYDLPHLHFELRYEGRPVAPPADWVACFTSSGAPPDSPAI